MQFNIVAGETSRVLGWGRYVQIFADGFIEPHVWQSFVPTISSDCTRALETERTWGKHADVEIDIIGRQALPNVTVRSTSQVAAVAPLRMILILTCLTLTVGNKTSYPAGKSVDCNEVTTALLSSSRKSIHDPRNACNSGFSSREVLFDTCMVGNDKLKIRCGHWDRRVACSIRSAVHVQDTTGSEQEDY